MLAVSGILYWTVTQLIGRIIQFTKMVPEYANSLTEMWNEVQSFFLRSTEDMPVEVVSSIETELASFLEGIRDWFLTIVN